MITTGNDQSASKSCRIHGRNAGGVFFRPEPYEGGSADYVCFHCWIEAGSPLQISKEQFYKLMYPAMKQ